LAQHFGIDTKRKTELVTTWRRFFNQRTWTKIFSVQTKSKTITMIVEALYIPKRVKEAIKKSLTFLW